MKQTIKSYVAIALFLLLFGTAYFVWPLLRNSLGTENTENRNLAEMPRFSMDTLSEFPAAYEAYLNDHLPFRSQLIKANSAIRYYLFRASASADVVIGKDGWLFYTADDSTECYLGRKLFTEDELKTIADNMQQAKDRLAEKGIPFVLFIAPNKERMYAEYLPGYYGPPAEVNPLQQVIAYLQTNTDVTVVCPLDALNRKKQESPMQLLYHKTDTHWNELGAYIGVSELMDALGLPWNHERASVEQSQDTTGDLANMLNLPGVIDPGDTYTVSGCEVPGTQKTEDEFFGSIRYVSPSCTNGKLMICRDSFCTAMSGFLGNAFTECNLVHSQAFTMDMIDREQPDYFVLETVERYLYGLLYFCD